mgnify:CR=1 FL=1
MCERIFGSEWENMFTDKTLLITGGTGSFGNAVLDAFVDSDIGEIRIFSRDETKQHDLRLKYNNDRIKYYIGDVRSYESIDAAMRGVDYVFSAAALKQVSSRGAKRRGDLVAHDKDLTQLAFEGLGIASSGSSSQ